VSPRPTSPPSEDFFLRSRPPLGDRALHLHLGEIRIQLEDLDRDVEERLSARYAPYSHSGISGEPAFTIAVRREETDYFITPPPTAEVNPVLLDLRGDTLSFLGYRLAARLLLGSNHGLAVLARGSYEPPERAFENLVRVTVAWQAALRGGALVHAASAVRDGRAYLFFGGTGAGKSTLAASSRRAQVVSDDLSLVLPGPAGSLRLVGSPFRGTFTGGPPIVGSFPVAAALGVMRSEEARVEEVPRSLAFAGLLANHPVVAEFFPQRTGLMEDLEKAFSGVAMARLHFRPDDSFWDAIERWDRERS
jgi:hypothetical protein